MRQTLSIDEMALIKRIDYLVGGCNQIEKISSIAPMKPFDEDVIIFLENLSKELIKDTEAKQYPDIVTLAFWIRTASLSQLKKRFEFKDGYIHLGYGTVFHIAPSNVPVNFAYSLICGILMGNANIVRVPSKNYPQVEIIVRIVNKVLRKCESIIPYIILVRYEKDKSINDLLSRISDVRVIWGGDTTISDIRKSDIQPRSTDVTFSDRFSIAVIDSDEYLAVEDKKRVALNFYNDTYLSDQNACTSPRFIAWLGENKEEAKKYFWNNLYDIVKEKYNFQAIMGVNKLSSAYALAANYSGVKILKSKDNLIIRVLIPEVTENTINYRDNSGFFLEYDCKDIMELKVICDDRRVQTVAVIGETEIMRPLIMSGIKGIDRVVVIGKTMDFDLFWDGYKLSERLSRTVVI